MKKGLLTFLFTILLLPFIQQCFPFITSAQLNGYIDYAANTEFSWTKWFDGSYQQGKEKYCNDWTGFRPDLVRLSNQINYSFFNRISSGGGYIGLNNCLFFFNYIDAYNGSDFVGEPIIFKKLVMLKAIQDTLAHLGKSLIVVHAPNKAFFYPECIPEPYRRQNPANNLQSYLRIGDSLGINQINFNGWFVSMKNTSKELLLSKQGTHWTNYGAFIGGDSLVRYIEKLRNIQMLHPVCYGITHTNKPSNPDADIADLANLIFPVADETFSYPNFTYIEDSTKKKPRIVFIGDSFVVNMLKNWTLQGVTTDWQFWFSFKYVLNSNNPNVSSGSPLIEHFDWQDEIDKTDCVVLMYTSINLCIDRNNFGSGFIEQEYNHYFPSAND